MSKLRNVSDSLKKSIAGRQNYRCVNNNDVTIRGIDGYICPFWKNHGDGVFDESGYEIDHIVELCISGNNDEFNLQALCLCCHSVKTSRFNRIYNKTNLIIMKYENEPTKYKCEHCRKHFSTKNRSKKHKKICKNKSLIL